MSDLVLHCDVCNRPLGTFLYGSGGIEEQAVISPKFVKIPVCDNNGNTIGERPVPFGVPDVTCFKCLGRGNKGESTT